MIFEETPLQGAYLITLEKIHDERGYFARSWCREEFEEHGLVAEVVQCNISYNLSAGTLRGMHFQDPPRAETKLVRCNRGAIYDVILDLRPDSATFCRHFGIELTVENGLMVYVPVGFAHGFQTLQDSCEIFYQMSESYSPEHSRGVRWDDPLFGISWPREVSVISRRDDEFPDSSREQFAHLSELS
jgi:dTDP-4-dehydrorhamnose 3,5-epimerase